MDAKCRNARTGTSDEGGTDNPAAIGIPRRNGFGMKGLQTPHLPLDADIDRFSSLSGVFLMHINYLFGSIGI